MMHYDIYNITEDADRVEKNSRMSSSVKEVAASLLTFLVGVGLSSTLLAAVL